MDELPAIGFGTWRAIKSESLIEAIQHGVGQAGSRHIDCAHAYGNKAVVGASLKSLFDRGGVAHQDLWVTSKLWNTFHDPANVERAFRTTLANLGPDYLDLYLIHFSVSFQFVDDETLNPKDSDGETQFSRVPLLATWRAMENLVALGLVRRIGTSNFTIAMLEKIRCGPEVAIQPWTNQLEQHLCNQQYPMLWYLRDRGIVPIGYSALGTKDFSKPKDPMLLDDPKLAAVAREAGQTPEAVEIRFIQALNPGGAVLVKSVNRERIWANLHMSQFELLEEQIGRLKARDRCFRYMNAQRIWNFDPRGEGW
jgi:diketogulonate reductase-like aldo/keto reductase